MQMPVQLTTPANPPATTGKGTSGQGQTGSGNAFSQFISAALGLGNQDALPGDKAMTGSDLPGQIPDPAALLDFDLLSPEAAAMLQAVLAANPETMPSSRLPAEGAGFPSGAAPPQPDLAMLNVPGGQQTNLAALSDAAAVLLPDTQPAEALFRADPLPAASDPAVKAAGQLPETTAQVSAPDIAKEAAAQHPAPPASPNQDQADGQILADAKSKDTKPGSPELSRQALPETGSSPVKATPWKDETEKMPSLGNARETQVKFLANGSEASKLPEQVPGTAGNPWLVPKEMPLSSHMKPKPQAGMEYQPTSGDAPPAPQVKAGPAGNSPEGASPARVPAFEAVAAQIIQQSKVMVSGRKSEIQIQLKPEYLGKVQLKLSLEDGLVTARFLVESARVGQVIEANLPQLRQTLQDAGVKFHQLSVDTGANFSAAFQEGSREHPGQGNGHRVRHQGIPSRTMLPEEFALSRTQNRGCINYLA